MSMIEKELSITMEAADNKPKIVATSLLVDTLVELQRIKDEFNKPIDKKIKEIEAELCARGLRELEDKNVKSTTFKGKTASVIVGMVQKLTILNVDKLKKSITDKWHKEVKTKELEYTITADFKRALISLYMNDYVADMKLEKLLATSASTVTLTADTKSLLLKKLKGDYEKDKKLFEAVLNRELRNELDEELYYIAQIKNFERIRKYFSLEEIEKVRKGIRLSSNVSETIKLTVRQ